MAKKSVKKPSKAETDQSDAVTPHEETVTPDAAEPEILDASEIDDAVDAMTPDTAGIDTDEASDLVEVSQPDPAPRKAGIWPLVIGGVAAAVFGFLAARADLIDSFLPPSWRAGSDQTALIQDLDSATDKIATLEGDIKDLTNQIANQPAPQEVPLDALNSAIADLTTRITTLENRPVITDATGSPVQNYDAQFAALQETAAAQQAEIDKLLADARLVEKSTTDAANNTLARAAATRIIAAIESGAPFIAALNDLEATDTFEIPQDLTDAASNGVASLAALQAAMPDAARAALAASRSAAGEETGGIGGFLKRSLGARSVEPREGSDPDAVLSRIEDAARNGRLTDALAEADTLPPEGQAAMADWLAQARTRNSVMSASETLMQRLVAN